MKKTLLERLSEIDAKMLDGDVSPAEEREGRRLVDLADAVPDMLSALKQALPYMDDLANSSNNAGERRAAMAMRKAIQTAEGKTENTENTENDESSHPDHPDDPTNEQRAIWALDAVYAYAEYKEGMGCKQVDVEPGTYISDLLADLMHLCADKDIPFGKMLETARTHYGAERK